MNQKLTLLLPVGYTHAMQNVLLSFAGFLGGRIRERDFRGTLEGFFLAFFFLPMLYFYLPIGFRFSMANFTYGASGHEPSIRAKLPEFFLGMFLSMYGIEILFRGLILRSLMRYFSWVKAFWFHLAAVNLLLFPLFWHYGWQMEGMGFLRFFLQENILEAFWALFFLRTGSLLATGFLHGAYNFGRFVMLNDAAGPFETLYFYSAAADDFYWLILAVSFLAVGVQILINRRWGIRER